MAELSRPIDREFNVEVEGGRFSTSFLNDLVDTHVNKIAPRYVKFQKLYEGKHKIQNRPRKDKNKPNNKLVNDFFGQTIDNTVGYFLGNPIVLNYTEPKKDKAPVEADPADVGVDLTERSLDTAVLTAEIVGLASIAELIMVKYSKGGRSPLSHAILTVDAYISL